MLSTLFNFRLTNRRNCREVWFLLKTSVIIFLSTGHRKTYCFIIYQQLDALYRFRVGNQYSRHSIFLPQAGKIAVNCLSHGQDNATVAASIELATRRLLAGA